MALPTVLSLNDLRSRDPFLVRVLRYMVSVHDREIYLVGGYLRDLFLGNVSKDVDLLVPGSPGELARAVARRFGGKDFSLKAEKGVYRVVLGRGENRRTMDFSTLKGASIEEDLSLRDFTINAMALEVGGLVMEETLLLPRDLVDKNYGWRDLERRLLRECHRHSFLMDPVRLVRALRFRHLLGLEFEGATLNHVKKYAPLVSRVPGERVAAEIMETLSHAGGAEVFSEVEETGLLPHLFPELVPLVGLEQNAYHHLDVWSHTLETLRQLDDIMSSPGKLFPRHAAEIRKHLEEPVQDTWPRKAFLRLAALYHDAGKALTFSRDETGRIHFYSHQEKSAEAVDGLAARLRLSRAAAVYLRRTVAHHMDIGFLLAGKASSRATERKLGRLGDELVDVVVLSTADRYATRGPMSTQEGLERYVAFCARLLEEYFRRKAVPPLLRGRDLLEELSLEEGPLVGRILSEIEEAQLRGEVETRGEALALARKLVPALMRAEGRTSCEGGNREDGRKAGRGSMRGSDGVMREERNSAG
jgi:poly(A) polymerase